MVSVVSLALFATAASAGVPPRNYSPRPASSSLRSLVGAIGGRASDAAAVKFAYLRKLDSHLQNLAAARLTGRSVSAAAGREGITLNGGAAEVDVYVNGDVDSAAAKLRSLGMHVDAVSRLAPERMVEGSLPVSALTDAAGLAATHAVLTVYTGVDVGAKTSQGDAAHNGPAARALGTNGSGVRVGVISDSINKVAGGVATSQASGDLPGPASVPAGSVTVLRDPTTGGSDEGRAMSEIIFDEAPGLRNMFFSTGGGGPASKAQSISDLTAAGVKVIADDIFYLQEPMFQDGIVAQAVDASKAAGVAYFSSAGNRARQSWEGTYSPVADPTLTSPDTNNFGGGDTIQTIGPFGAGANVEVALQWDEPYGGATTDLAIDVYVGSTFIGTADTDNITTGIPLEDAAISLGGANNVSIAIRRVAGTRTPFMKYIVFAPGSATFNIAEHATNSDTINPDAASSNGALTVAASSFGTPATPEVYSSRGPAFRLFDKFGNRLAAPDVRAKPDVDAADAVSTTVPGFDPFGGTSAATPSDAGIGVLLRSNNPTMPVDEVYAILKNPANTIDCTLTAGVPDSDCGFGFDLADKAVQQALDTTPPVIGSSVNPPAPNGPNGWYTVPVSVNWSLADAQSPVVDPVGCANPTNVTAEGTIPLTCTAVSAGGTSSKSVTIKHDQSPPTAIKFTGISAKHFDPTKLPKVANIHCTATDAGSGVDGCTVSGFSKAVGKHKLTGTATNDAGLKGTGSLSYTVDAIGGLKLPKRFSLRSLLRSGLPITLDVAKGTKVGAKLTATLSGASAAKKLVIGTFNKKFKKSGKFKIRVRLSSSGKHAILGGHVTKIKLTVTGKAAGKKTTKSKTFRVT
jgi:hypothetical protein